MSVLQLEVKVLEEKAAASLQRLRKGLADRRALHATIAVGAERLTTGHLGGLRRHRTAQRLGARPTQHYARTARRVESSSDDEKATVSIPRTSGLRRAFSDIVIKPGSGKKYLTLPEHKRTYGKRVREFPPGTFRFAVIGGRHTALVFAEKGDAEYGSVAYWLRRKVTLEQDRTLLPSDADYLAVATGETREWVKATLKGEGGTA